jgi:transketolase
LKHHGPTVIALSRQALPHLANSSIHGALQGAYTLGEFGAADKTSLILIASGSEVSVALAVAQQLSASGDAQFGKIRVVSAPSVDRFALQPIMYRREVLTPGVPVISLEALTVFGWSNMSHYSIGMHSFGASAPGGTLMDHFGFTTGKVTASVQSYMALHAKECEDMGVANTFGPLPVHF